MKEVFHTLSNRTLIELIGLIITYFIDIIRDHQYHPCFHPHQIISDHQLHLCHQCLPRYGGVPSFE